MAKIIAVVRAQFRPAWNSFSNVKPPENSAIKNAVAAPIPCSLGWREEPAIDPDHDDRKKAKDGENPPNILAFNRNVIVTGRGEIWLQEHRYIDGCHVEHDAQKSRNDAGNKELSDIGLRQKAVDDQNNTGRDQDAEGAAGGDGARCQAVGVTGLAH
jgi:hypothetical protein